MPRRLRTSYVRRRTRRRLAYAGAALGAIVGVAFSTWVGERLAAAHDFGGQDLQAFGVVVAAATLVGGAVAWALSGLVMPRS